jgi:hypothetical protein
MTWKERSHRVSFTKTKKSLGFRSETVISLRILTNEDRSDTNWVSADEGLSSVAVMKNESENTIELLNEIFNVAKFLVKMKEYLTVAGTLELEAVLSFDGLVVVDLSVGNDTDIAHLERLVSCFGEIDDPQAVEAKNQLLRELFKLHVVGSSSVLSEKVVPKVSVREREFVARSGQVSEDSTHYEGEC